MPAFFAASPAYADPSTSESFHFIWDGTTLMLGPAGRSGIRTEQQYQDEFVKKPGKDNVASGQCFIQGKNDKSPCANVVLVAKSKNGEHGVEFKTDARGRFVVVLPDLEEFELQVKTANFQFPNRIVIKRGDHVLVHLLPVSKLPQNPGFSRDP